MKHPATAVAVLLAMALAPSAMAAKGPHPAPSTSSIAQYVEQVPSATGSVAVGRGSGTAAKLTPAAQKALSKSGGSDASTLQKVADSPQYGAPAQTPVSGRSTNTPATRATTTHAGGPKAKSKGATSKVRPTPTPSTPATSAAGAVLPTHAPSPVSAAGSTVGASTLLAVAVVLLAITAGGVVLMRRRSH